FQRSMCLLPKRNRWRPELDRREFLRRIVIISALGVASAAGAVTLAERILSDQRAGNSLPPPTTQGSTSPETITILTTDTTTVTGVPTTFGGSETTTSKRSNGTTTTSTQASPSSSSSSSAPAGYILLAALSDVSGKTFAYFNHPNFGSSILLNYNGTWKAFSAICTHAGCTVNYASPSIVCPCHPGYFSPVNGAVVSGPPPTKLNEYDVKVINSNLYVGTSVIN
ncbi:MAG: ubiquinol-cytochrome c reductase iron-sulfur subunit, partial [Nitrososphaerales archaeon]